MAETLADPIRREKAQNYVVKHVSEGSLQPRIDKVFSFAQIIEAYQYLESNTQVGKIVVSVS
jgi:NADPH:quinone reductase-like Zn-dependent oxidoreductase